MSNPQSPSARPDLDAKLQELGIPEPPRKDAPPGHTYMIGVGYVPLMGDRVVTKAQLFGEEPWPDEPKRAAPVYTRDEHALVDPQIAKEVIRENIQQIRQQSGSVVETVQQGVQGLASRFMRMLGGDADSSEPSNSTKLKR